MSFLAGRAGQIILAGGAAKAAKQEAALYSKELFGYDFLGLAQKILIFFAVAYVIKLYFDIVAGVSGFWIAVLGFFRVNLPTNAPDSIMQFMTNGYKGITYWQVVKVAALALVTYEAIQYYEKNKPNHSVMTLGIFGLIIGFLALITWDIFKSFTEGGLLGANATTFKGFSQLLQNNLGFGKAPVGTHSSGIGDKGKI